MRFICHQKEECKREWIDKNKVNGRKTFQQRKKRIQASNAFGLGAIHDRFYCLYGRNVFKDASVGFCSRWMLNCKLWLSKPKHRSCSQHLYHLAETISMTLICESTFNIWQKHKHAKIYFFLCEDVNLICQARVKSWRDKMLICSGKIMFGKSI